MSIEKNIKRRWYATLAEVLGAGIAWVKGLLGMAEKKQTTLESKSSGE